MMTDDEFLGASKAFRREGRHYGRDSTINNPGHWYKIAASWHTWMINDLKNADPAQKNDLKSAFYAGFNEGLAIRDADRARHNWRDE